MSVLQKFDDFYKILHKDAMSDLYIVTVNIKDLIDRYKKMISNAEQELKSLETSNKKGRINDLRDQLNSIIRNLILFRKSILKNLSYRQ